MLNTTKSFMRLTTKSIMCRYEDRTLARGGQQQQQQQQQNNSHATNGAAYSVIPLIICLFVFWFCLDCLFTYISIYIQILAMNNFHLSSYIILIFIHLLIVKQLLFSGGFCSNGVIVTLLWGRSRRRSFRGLNLPSWAAPGNLLPSAHSNI